MRHILHILAASALLAACTGAAPAPAPVKGPKGDLAYFELRGNVKTMESHGATYNFDEDGRLVIDPEDGKVEIATDPDNGLTYYTYTPEGDDPFMYWSEFRPFRRGYDSNGRLSEIAFHYEMCIGIYYNDDGTVSREDWVEESWGGCSFYNYVDGVRTTAINQSGDIASLSGIFEEDIIWDTFICYTYDQCGNWTSRFGVSHYNGGVVGNVTRRSIEYHSVDKPSDFEPIMEGIILSGILGADDVALCFTDIDNEYYGPSGLCQISDGKGLRVMSVDNYDRSSGHLVMNLRDSKDQDAGSFSGTLTPTSYSGTYTPAHGKSVEFNFTNEQP